MINAINKALRAALGTSAITAALGASGRIYTMLAPDNVAVPYVIIGPYAGGSTNDTPNDAFDMRVTIKVVAGDARKAGDVEKLIRDALHLTTLTYEDGWKHQDCEHGSPIFYLENVANSTLYHAGGIYRVRGCK